MRNMRNTRNTLANQFHLTREKVRKLLLKDTITRKTNNFVLLNSDEISVMYDEIPIGKHTFKCDFLHVNSRSYSIQDKEERNVKEIKDWTTLESESIKMLENSFPFITEILKQFHGKIVTAGGAIFRSFNKEDSYRRDRIYSDLDFYFVPSNIDEANSLLLDVLSFLTQKWLDQTNGNVYIVRTQYVVNCYLTSHQDTDEDTDENTYYDFRGHSYHYQFILRAYPTMGSIVGGFDLGPCMVLYDGYRITGTELGIWSALNKICIVDTSRRSTTFEKRINKYNRSCIIVYPGLDKDTKPDFHDRIHYADMIEKILKYFQNNKLVFSKTGEIKRGKSKKYISEYNLREKIIALTQKYGYELTNLDLKEIPSEPIPKEEGIELLKSLLEPGFAIIPANKRYFEIEEYGCHGEITEGVNYDPGIVAWFQKNNIDLIAYSKKIITLKNFKINVEDHWRRNIPNNKNKNDSDYYDGSDPCFTECINSKNILNGKYEHVRSMFILKTENGVISPYSIEDDTFASFVMSINDYPEYVVSLSDRSNGKSGNRPSDNSQMRNIKAVIQQKLKEPLLINVCRGLEKRVGNLNDLINKIESGERGFDEIGKIKLKKVIQELFPDDTEELLSLIIKKKFKQARKNIDVLTVKYAEILKSRFEEVQSYISEVKWISKNPGRQWTSSINPIIEHPREWYGYKYRSFFIFDEKVETTLRCIYKFSDHPIRRFPKDLFKLLLLYVVKSHC